MFGYFCNKYTSAQSPLYFYFVETVRWGVFNIDVGLKGKKVDNH